MRDYQAEYGYQPSWTLQREKQDRAAENRRRRQEFARSEREGCPKCGGRLFADDEGLACGDCDHFEAWE